MSLPERLRQLDEEIVVHLQQLLAEWGAEVRQELRRVGDSLEDRLANLRASLPEGLLTEERLAPVTEEARLAGRRAGFQLLQELVARIDQARTQTEVLTALLEGAGQLASRAALFLTFSGEVRGWGSYGFGEASQTLQALTLDYATSPVWARFAEGRGTVLLGTGDCADLCSRIESPLPKSGILVPLVLRDRLAAALYVDRLDEGEIPVEGLQILAYVAAQALETLPFRQRAGTPSLRLYDEGPLGEAGLALWEPTGEMPEEAVAPEPAAAPELPAEPGPGPEVAAAEAFEEAPQEAPPARAGVEAPPVEDTTAGAWALEEEEEEPTLHFGRPLAGEAARPREEAAPQLEEVELEEAREEAQAEPPSPVWRREEEGERIEPIQQVEEVYEPQGISSQPAAEPEPEAVTATPSVTPEAPPAEAEEEEPPEERTQPKLQRPLVTPPAPPTGPAAAEPPAARRSAAPGREVQPPEDVQGPGWAFTTTRVPTTTDEEARHEEARRLARLLVSEIQLYNEEQVEEGRRNRDIYERLKEDIDRSRQMYEERVDEGIRNTTDYFYQELVRILAAGDPKALGI